MFGRFFRLYAGSRRIVSANRGGREVWHQTGTPTVIAPSWAAQPTISPPSGPVGTVFILTEGVVAGTGPITLSGRLMRGATDVTSQIAVDPLTGELIYTATAMGALTWQVDATGPGGGPISSDVANASVTGALITANAGFSVSNHVTISGRMTVNVTSVPPNSEELWLRTMTPEGIETVQLLSETPSAGAYVVDLPALAGRRAAFMVFGSNAYGDGPYPANTDSWAKEWIAGAAAITVRIKPTVLRPGEKAILSIETRGYPHPALDSTTLTFDGSPVSLDGKGNVRSFTVPADGAAKALVLSGAVSNAFGSAADTTTTTVSAAISWAAPTAIASRAALDTALAAAVGGEVFLLADGSYGSLTWGKNLTTPVKLKAANPAMAVFSDITMSGSTRRGMYLEGVRVTGETKLLSSASIARLENCTFNNNVSLEIAEVVVKGNTFDLGESRYGLSIRNSAGSLISWNTFKDGAGDQGRMYGFAADLIIEENLHLRTVAVTVPADVHPDCFQIYGLTNFGGTPKRFAFRRNRMFDTMGSQGVIWTDARHFEGYVDCAFHDNMIRTVLVNKLQVEVPSRGTLITNNSLMGTLYIVSTLGGLITRNIASTEYKPGTVYATGSITDNYINASAASGGSLWPGDGDLMEEFIPVVGAGVSDLYGATTWIRSQIVTPPPADLGTLVAVTQVRADGWSAVTDASTADRTPTKDETTQHYFRALQPGYDTSGSATYHSDRIKITKRLRTAGTGTRVSVSAMTNYVLAGATLPGGGTNNSTRVSPKPKARWGLPDRRIVGNTLVQEVVAIHKQARNGQFVAAVRFRATDGTNTVTQVVGDMTVSPKSLANQAVLVYRCSLDISSLTEGDITLNAEVIPWLGTGASIYDSASETDRWRFSPRRYTKNLTDFNTPRIAVVKPSTGTSGGVVSRDPAAARAAPFASIYQALLWFKNNSTNVDGAQIWLAEAVTGGNWATGSSNRPSQRFCAVTITHDPTVSRAVATLSGAGGISYIGRDTTLYGLPVGSVAFKDLVVLSVSTGIQYVGEMDWEDCDLTGTLNYSTACEGRIYGLTHAGGAGLNGGNQIMRGVYQPNNANATNGFDVRAFFGNYIQNPGIQRTVATIGTPQPAFMCFNEILKWAPTNNALADQTAECVVQNIIESTGTGNVPILSVSADSNSGSTDHYVEMHNTVIGGGPGGSRSNTRYDETLGTYRTHENIADLANIWGCMRASKGDLFTIAGATSEEQALHVGNWQFTWGVNCGGNVTLWLTNFPHEFDGIASVLPPDQTTFIDPGFAVNASASGSGAGGGSYEITTGAASVAYDVMPDRMLCKFDLRGRTRTRTDAGALRIAA